MSAFSRFVYGPASRRSYSYFSSKSGGGRYFNSAKSPKSAVVAAKPNKADPSPDSPQDNVQTGVPPNPNGMSLSASNPIADPTAHPSPNAPAGSGPADASREGSSNNASTPQSSTNSLANAFAEFSQSHLQHQHQTISPKDFKMHQFFSLHRPLLLIGQPASIFRPVPPNHPLIGALPSETEMANAQKRLDGAYMDSFIDADADAEAARQLTRALTMSKAGSTVSWEDTLKNLGLDVSKDMDRVNLQQQFEKEWEDVMMDSTKRKRRKKMKKHKLKKRRRATRAERLRLK